jgi:hypothetical protein
MKVRRTTHGLTAALLMALGVGLVSCISTLNRRGDHHYLTLDNGKLSTGGPPHMQGRCVKITYSGSSGSIGCDIEEIPTEGICPPPGTRDAHGEVVDCPPDSGQRIQQAGGFNEEPPAAANPPGRFEEAQVFRFFGLPIEIDMELGCLEYDIEVRARSRRRARQIRDAILHQARMGPAGFQNEVPGVYVIRHLIHARLHNSELVFTLANKAAFQSLDLSVNGVRGYRSLADAVHTRRNGWNLAGLSIPLSDLNYGLDPSVTYINGYRLDFKHVGLQARTLEGEWGYTL